jgi:hypothetical protein
MTMEKLMNCGRRVWMLGVALCVLSLTWATAGAQAAPSALGTVKSVAGTTITIATDKGQQYTVDASGSPSVLELAPGSMDLKTAHAGDLGSVAVGDRVLVSGTAGDSGDKLKARRLILMKAGDLAKQRQQEQQDWARRGSGGLVMAVDPGAGTITIGTGTTTNSQQKTVVHVTPATKFRRYASDSVKFEDAKPSKISDVQIGDQLRVLGNKAADQSVQAEQVISGTFKNIAGTISAVDPAAGTLTIKDLSTKKNVLVKVTANSDLRAIPAMVAQRFAQGAGAAGGRGMGQGDQAGGQRAGGQRGGGPGGPGGRRLGGADLSGMISSFPKDTLAELHNGQAVMITATQPNASSTDVTAVTVLSGVEPILTAAPTMTLTPGVGGGEGGGMDSGGGMDGGGGGGR